MTNHQDVNFQNMIMTLDQYWADVGCVIWQPHNVKVGAGTANPGTLLRVLGPEPWNVAYPEPSARPADGRYGENPNRWAEYYQYQVILKPVPSNHLQLYLESFESLGIDWRLHDIRLVEDNWQSPALGAWGLGWEIWMDGMEITQYTYFQQAAGVELDLICLEITYGLERIAMFLQDVPSIPDIRWLGDIEYGDVHLLDEIDYCKYNFDYADISRLQNMYELFDAEAQNAIEHGLVLPSYDYVLQCSHIFNVLDARGAISVTQRSEYFSRMRKLAKQCADLYLKQREDVYFPLSKRRSTHIALPEAQPTSFKSGPLPDAPADLLVEIGTEELPASDISAAVNQLHTIVLEKLAAAFLDYEEVYVTGTPQRLVIHVKNVAPMQSLQEQSIKGPSQELAFDDAGNPTQAAVGFARKNGVAVKDLEIREINGGSYCVAVLIKERRSAVDVLPKVIKNVLKSLHFNKSMRWNTSNVTFARPIRWLVALLGNVLIDVDYAGVTSSNLTRGLRSVGAPYLELESASHYFDVMQDNSITIDIPTRRQNIEAQIQQLAEEVDGKVLDDQELLDEVTNLVEYPIAIRGSFDPSYLKLPREVLITVMKIHQRYFPIIKDGNLLPHFITISNGNSENIEIIRKGNEAVVGARFADASFFYDLDTRHALEDFLPRLEGLMFHEMLGSYADKVERMQALAPSILESLDIPEKLARHVIRAVYLSKADLATNMVIEFTSLQGIVGGHYARHRRESEGVAHSIEEQYLPRFPGDKLPSSIISALTGIIDRIDTLVGLVSIGIIPTGSNDPHGLRRTSNGLMQILVEYDIRLSFSKVVKAAAKAYGFEDSSQAMTNAISFFQHRLGMWLQEQNYRQDFVKAVIAECNDDPASAHHNLNLLSQWALKDDFTSVVATYMRTVRIVKEYRKLQPLDEDKLQEPAARRLLNAYHTANEKLLSDTSVNQLFEVLVDLHRPIEKFFNDLLVMHDDQQVQTARVGLLQRIARLPEGIIDLTQVTLA